MNDYRLVSNDPLVDLIRSKSINTWIELISFLKKIPYGRNSNRFTPELVITEEKGTCSSKHALLKKVADLHDKKGYELVIGIYKMNTTNTPKIGNVLIENNLEYIPEAHCYLKHNSGVIDVTTESSNYNTFKKDILTEKAIRPNQVGNFKIAFHQNYIQNWIIEEKINFSLEEIWNIREQCIKNLSS